MISMHTDLHVYMCHYVNKYIDKVLPEYISIALSMGHYIYVSLLKWVMDKFAKPR